MLFYTFISLALFNLLQPESKLANPYVFGGLRSVRTQELPLSVLFLVNPIRQPNKRNGTNHEFSHFFFSEAYRAYFSLPYL